MHFFTRVGCYPELWAVSRRIGSAALGIDNFELRTANSELFYRAASGESASAYASTAMIAAFSFRCFLSILSKVSAAVW